MFACQESLLGPFVVKAVGQGVVDAINVGVIDEGIIRRVGVGNIVLGGKCLVF